MWTIPDRVRTIVLGLVYLSVIALVARLVADNIGGKALLLAVGLGFIIANTVGFPSIVPQRCDIS
jgi:hypothetical protein